MIDKDGNLTGICSPKNMPDVWQQINSPSHYNQNSVETIDLIQESMGIEEFKGYLKGNIIKYISRYRYKEKENPEKDLLKAKWYLERLIKEIRNDG
jgi:hypothetical protein